MAHWRQITSTLLIALIVATGVIASTHTHAHVADNGQQEIHVGQCAHNHCCDHGHSHEVPGQSDDGPVDSSDHDHDECQICRLLADFQTTSFLLSPPTVFEAVVLAQFFQPDCEPVERLVSCVLSRGPPVLGAIDV